MLPLRFCAALAVCLVGYSACSGDRLVVGGGGNSDCVPGDYSGTYDCTAGGDAGLLPLGNGSILMHLQGDRGGAILTIAPGANITGNQAGETWEANLTGSLDCASNKLTGSLGAVTLSVSGSNFATIDQEGGLAAEYGATDAGTPGLLNGVMVWSGQLVPGLGASPTCTWSATLATPQK